MSLLLLFGGISDEPLELGTPGQAFGFPRHQGHTGGAPRPQGDVTVGLGRGQGWSQAGPPR